MSKTLKQKLLESFRYYRFRGLTEGDFKSEIHQAFESKGGNTPRQLISSVIDLGSKYKSKKIDAVEMQRELKILLTEFESA